MTPKTFYTQLAVVSGIVAIILALVHSHELIGPHQSFSWINCGFFIAFCIIIYYAMAASTKSEDKSLFGKLFLLSIFFKMLLCILIVIAYEVIVDPEDQYFIFPFGIIYLCFTSFEVYFVTKLAKP